MAFLIAFFGIVALVVFATVGLLVSAGSGGRGRLVVLGLGLLLFGASWLWGALSDDGQPWYVWIGRWGGDNLDDVGDGSPWGLFGRTLLRNLGFGLVLGWFLVVLVELIGKRKRGSD